MKNELGDHFFNLTFFIVTVSFAFLSIVIGSAALFGVPKLVDWITNRVKVTHERMINHSEHLIAARVFGRFSAHCINLYKDIDKTKNPHLYNSYLQIAIDLSSSGYDHAKRLSKLISEQGEVLPPLEEQVLIGCINNKLFYLATQAAGKDKLEKEEEKVLNELVAELEGFKERTLYKAAAEETLSWANLILGYEATSKVQQTVQSLLDNPRIDPEWKEEVVSRYETLGKSCGKRLMLKNPSVTSTGLK